MVKKTKKIIEITSETSEIFIVRRPRSVVTAWCAACQKNVSLLAPEAAAKAAGVSTRAVYRLIEADEIHFTETEDGQMLICQNSLL